MADKNILKEALEAKKAKRKAQEAIERTASAVLNVDEGKEVLRKLVNESLQKLNESDMDEMETEMYSEQAEEGDFLEEDDEFMDDVDLADLEDEDVDGEKDTVDIDVDGEEEVSLSDFDDDEDEDLGDDIMEAINELKEELEMNDDEELNEEEGGDEMTDDATEGELEDLLKSLGEGDDYMSEEDDLEIESLLGEEDMDETDGNSMDEDEMLDDLIEAVMKEMDDDDDEEEEEDMDESLSVRRTLEKNTKVPNRNRNRKGGQVKKGYTNESKSYTAADFRESYRSEKAKNKQLVETISELKEDFQYLNESSDKLMNILRIFVEHSTTKEEKMKIIERFETVSRKKDIETLSEQIKKELNTGSKGNLIGNKNVNVESIKESKGSVKTKKSFDEIDRINELIKYKSN